RGLDIGVFGLQRHGDAGKRSASPDGASETIDLAFRLRPNLGPGRLEVALAIGDIVELIGPDRAGRIFLGKPQGEAAGEFHVIIGIGIGDRRNLDQVGALQPQQVLFLLALRVGNDDHGLVAQGIGDERETDSGVARRTFDDQSARPQAPARDRVVDDGERRAVLYRSAGVHELRLAQNGAAGQFRRLAQFDERGCPDRFDYVFWKTHLGERPVPVLLKKYRARRY